MRTLYLYFLIVVVFASCDEPFKLDLNQTPDKVVIEGLVTDQPKMQGVKISRSTDFYGSGKTPRVTNAVVTVTDDLGNVTSFIHNPRSHADSSGIYVPASNFVGVIGRTYKLKVDVSGTTYEAEEKLSRVIPIDSLNYAADNDEEEDPEIEGRFYEVLMYAREPQDEENFYLFKFYRNDSLTYNIETDIYYSDDEILAEEINGIAAPIYYGIGDKARIEVYSISRVGFVYYNDLSGLLNNDAGGMFGPIPSSPRTNLSNEALGYFQVSAVNSAEIKLE
jgi:hypothetical protein